MKLSNNDTTYKIRALAANAVKEISKLLGDKESMVKSYDYVMVATVFSSILLSSCFAAFIEAENFQRNEVDAEIEIITHTIQINIQNEVNRSFELKEKNEEKSC